MKSHQFRSLGSLLRKTPEPTLLLQPLQRLAIQCSGLQSLNSRTFQLKEELKSSSKNLKSQSSILNNLESEMIWGNQTNWWAETSMKRTLDRKIKKRELKSIRVREMEWEGMKWGENKNKSEGAKRDLKKVWRIRKKCLRSKEWETKQSRFSSSRFFQSYSSQAPLSSSVFQTTTSSTTSSTAIQVQTQVLPKCQPSPSIPRKLSSPVVSSSFLSSISSPRMSLLTKNMGYSTKMSSTQSPMILWKLFICFIVFLEASSWVFRSSHSSIYCN